MSIEVVTSYRETLRKNQSWLWYSGWGHLGFTSTFCLVAIVLAIREIDSVRPVELLAVPLTFLYANLVEYWFHRGPMHRKTRGLGLVFQRHTVEHHHFYTHEKMGWDSSRDFRLILFPAWLIVILFTFGIVPIGYVLHRAISSNVALLFAATNLAYFLNYEWFHFAYHAPEGSWLSRMPLLRVLRRHHGEHHDPRAMSSCNFNITYPLADVVFGTCRKKHQR
jgi:hypothetical protein